MNPPEKETEIISRQDALSDSKHVEFYSQGVAAWFNSALEHDKSLLTLSVAGIGVLVSFMQSAIDSISSLLLYVSAILAFMICLVSVLLIFKRNQKHIVDVFNGKNEDDSMLEIMDMSANYSFVAGMLLSALLGISLAINTYIDKGKNMANENGKNSAQSVPAFDSVNGMKGLLPCNESFNQMKDLQKSFNGMSQLQGQTQNVQATATQAAATQTTSVQNSQNGATEK
jgi:hypothetical protein